MTNSNSGGPRPAPSDINPRFSNWKKSTKSDSGGNCVEVATDASGAIGVRDSKNPVGAILVFNAKEWRAFADAARKGFFDLS